jgi:MOSC domain-containing protein YiiM
MQRGEKLGSIVRLQVQQIPIKAKQVGYMPQHILAVERSAVDAWGMLGWDGMQWVVDAHHKAHPASRAGGRRPLSVGFTGHYDAMEERFGKAAPGVAGENILIDGPPASLDDLGDGLIVATQSGDDLLLERPRVAAPCVEFTSFMLGLDHVAPLAEIEAPLADLHDGVRGFIVAADHTPQAVEVNVGDVVYLIDT